MPELPDIAVYIEALEERIAGRVLEKVRIGVPFVLRSVAPEPDRAEGRRWSGLRVSGSASPSAWRGISSSSCT